MKDYTITKVATHARLDPDPAFQQRLRLKFRTIASFLQSHNLTKGVLLPENVPVEDSFAIRTSDLTSEGIEFMKRAYVKWQKSHDRGKSPSDTKLLEQELAKLRGDK